MTRRASFCRSLLDGTFPQLVRSAPDHPVPGLKTSGCLHQVALTRTLSHIHPLGVPVPVPDNEGALGGGHHAGLGNKERRP